MSRITVTPAELKTVIYIAITRLRPDLVRRLVRQSNPDRRRDLVADQNDARDEVAAAITAAVTRPGWEVTRPEPVPVVDNTSRGAGSRRYLGSQQARSLRSS